MRFPGLCVLPSLALSLAAMASEDTSSLQTIEVNGPGSNQLRRDDAMGRVILGRAELGRYGDSTLADVLKRQPGLSVAGGEIRMRGLGGGYTQILIDGQPAPASFDISTLSPDLIERVEIQRSAQADASSQAVAGSLNLILRKTAGPRRTTAKVSAERQGAEISPAATVQWSAGGGAAGYGVTTTLSETRLRVQSGTEERTRDGGVTSLHRLHDDDEVRTRRINAAPRVDLKLDAGNTLTWQGLLDLSRADARGAQSDHTLQGTPGGYPESTWHSLSDSWLLKSDLSWMQRLAAGRLTLKASAEAGNRHGDYLFLGDNAAGVPWLSRAVASRALERRASTSGKYLTGLTAGHDIAVGWEAAGVRREERRHQQDRGPDSVPVYLLQQDYNASVRQLALFVQDEWTVNRQLQAYVGMRWEGLDTRTDGPDHAATSSRVWSPVVQTVWKLPHRARDQLRLSLARTYKAPQPRDLVPRRFTVNNGNGPAQPDYQGNPRLRPELSWGLDAALESYFEDEAMLSVSAYARRISDVVQLKLWQENGVWVSSPANGGVAHVHGVEVDGRMPLFIPWRAGFVTEVRTNISRNWSRVEGTAGPDNRLGNQAPLTVNLGADLRLPRQLNAGANWRLTSGWRARTAQSLTEETGRVRELEAYAGWPAIGGRMRLGVANMLQSHRQTGRIYDDGLYASSRLTSSRQHRLIRLQFEAEIK